MEFDTIHFKLTDDLKAPRKFPKCYVERHLWVKPEPLHVLCSRVCDYLPEEPCFKWTNMQVLMWIKKIGFPQYSNTFYENMINGRTLLLVDASALCAMNIKDFDHIQTIAKAIRDLYKVEKILFKRSISVPPRYPDTHFKLYRVLSGPTYQTTTRSQLWRRMHIIQDIPPHRNHWITLHKYLQHQPQNQIHRIGYAPRANMYYVRPNPNPIPRKPSFISGVDLPCRCIPPCECGWKEEHYREPWKLTFLLDFSAAMLNESLKPGDVIVTQETPQAENPPEKPPKGDQVPCACFVPHECHFKTLPEAPKVLTIVRCCEQFLNEIELT